MEARRAGVAACRDPATLCSDTAPHYDLHCRCWNCHRCTVNYPVLPEKRFIFLINFTTVAQQLNDCFATISQLFRNNCLLITQHNFTQTAGYRLFTSYIRKPVTSYHSLISVVSTRHGLFFAGRGRGWGAKLTTVVRFSTKMWATGTLSLHAKIVLPPSVPQLPNPRPRSVQPVCMYVSAVCRLHSPRAGCARACAARCTRRARPRAAV